MAKYIELGGVAVEVRKQHMPFMGCESCTFVLSAVLCTQDVLLQNPSVRACLHEALLMPIECKHMLILIALIPQKHCLCDCLE